MDFSFSDAQDTVRDLAREILEAEVTLDRVRAAERHANWMDDKLWHTLAEAKLLGIAIPDAHGGMGMGFAELCVLLEEAGRVVMPGPWVPTLVLAALPLAAFGTHAQQAEWLPRIAAGDAIATTALLDAGSADVAAPATRGSREGDAVILDGVKRFVPFAQCANVMLIPATTDDGVAVFLVDPLAAGVTTTAQVTSTGQPLVDVTLSGVRVAASARLGGMDGDGAAILRWLEPRALTALVAMQVGVSDRALHLTADYTKERVQFGVPIGSFQAVQHRAADGFIDLETMRWTCWRAAWRLSQGLPADREAWVAKFWAADCGSRIANASLHLHGGMGADVDYPIQRYFLWSKALELDLGGARPTLARLGRDMARTGPQTAG